MSGVVSTAQIHQEREQVFLPFGQKIFLENERNKANGLDLLRALETQSLKVIFLDPQYRGLLDKMSYGNGWLA